MRIALIGLAGAAGALGRYGLGVVIGLRTFPWTTLGINLAGSFLLGLLLVIAGERGWPDTVTLPLAIGFLGAFTTFSTFSYEAFTLARTDREAMALAYVAASVLGGFAMAAAGYVTGRAFT